MQEQERPDVREDQGVEAVSSTDVPPQMSPCPIPAPLQPAQVEVSPPGTGFLGESGAPSFIYAIGTIQARFPSLGVEREFAQAVREATTANLTDQQLIYEVLSRPENRYLVREVCWVFTVENLDTYILQPRAEDDLSQLLETIKPVKEIDVDVVIGFRGPIAPPEMCNGLQVPIVLCDRIYSFDVETFINAIPKPEGMEDEPFRQASRELFSRIMQLTDNAGEMDEHRAINYLALRYPVIYAHGMEMSARDHSLSSVDVRLSRLSGTRKVVQVIFSYVNRNTDVVEKFFIRVDVTEKWPFLVSKLQPYYDR